MAVQPTSVMYSVVWERCTVLFLTQLILHRAFVIVYARALRYARGRFALCRGLRFVAGCDRLYARRGRVLHADALHARRYARDAGRSFARRVNCDVSREAARPQAAFSNN